ncbi:hypothetical protein Tco_1373824 [Tanacetum coccineum]
MALNDRATPPPETWVNPCYWLSTWKETYSHKIQPICGTKYWEKSTCPTHLATQVSCPGGNNVEASGSASGQAQQTEPVVGQDGSGGSGAGARYRLYLPAAGEGGQVLRTSQVNLLPVLKCQ